MVKDPLQQPILPVKERLSTPKMALEKGLNVVRFIRLSDERLEDRCD